MLYHLSYLTMWTRVQESNLLFLGHEPNVEAVSLPRSDANGTRTRIYRLERPVSFPIRRWRQKRPLEESNLQPPGS